MKIDELKDKLDAIKFIRKPCKFTVNFDGHGEFATEEVLREVTAKEYRDIHSKRMSGD